MTGRSVTEWIGKTPDSMPRRSVRDRMWTRQDGLCGCGCGLPLKGKPIQCEHIVPLIDGGENRESNLSLWLEQHSKLKTAREAMERAPISRKRYADRGIKKKSTFPNARSGGWRTRMDGTTVRRDQ